MNRLKAWWNVAIPQAIAWRLPRSVVRFAAIRLFARASTTKYSGRTPDAINIWEALGAWDD